MYEQIPQPKNSIYVNIGYNCTGVDTLGYFINLKFLKTNDTHDDGDSAPCLPMERVRICVPLLTPLANLIHQLRIDIGNVGDHGAHDGCSQRSTGNHTCAFHWRLH